MGAGTLSPWSGLTVAQIQVIIDKVYGADKYTVVPGDVWCGLVCVDFCSCGLPMTMRTQIGYRLHDWHGGFATHSQKGIKIYLDGDDGEDEEEYEEGPVDGEFISSNLDLLAPILCKIFPPMAPCLILLHLPVLAPRLANSTSKPLLELPNSWSGRWSCTKRVAPCRFTGSSGVTVSTNRYDTPASMSYMF